MQETNLINIKIGTKSYKIRRFLLIFLFLYSAVLIAGLVSEPSLGDEVYHYRFAKNFYWQAHRPIVDISYLNNHSDKEVVYYYDVFWHFTLSKIWKAIGHISFIAAQIYQSLFYLLLIFITYLIGKELYSEEIGLYSALLVATVPMVAVFSTLFYIDVPSTFFSALCVLLLLKKRYFWAGVSLGLMYMTKRHTLLFLPAIISICLLYGASKFRIRLRNLLIMLIVSAAIISPDLCWREKNFNKYPPNIFTSSRMVLGSFIGLLPKTKSVSPTAHVPISTVVHRPVPSAAAHVSISSAVSVPISPLVPTSIFSATPAPILPLTSSPTISPLVSPPVSPPLSATGSPLMHVALGDVATFTNMLCKDVGFTKYFKKYIFISYFGLSLLMGIILYFVSRKFRRNDIILWALVVNYVIFYIHFLGYSNEVRYMMPVIPFLGVLAAISIGSSGSRFLKNLIIGICLTQLFVCSFYVGLKRRIPLPVKEGFTFIREHTPANANVFYIEYLALDATDRRILRSFDDDPSFKKMYWSKDPKVVLKAMDELDIDYIMVKKSRIYDDTKQIYFGGYPKSFIDKLPGLSFAKLAFENNEISIWKIKR